MSQPFIDEEFTFTNPDGSTVRVRGPATRTMRSSRRWTATRWSRMLTRAFTIMRRCPSDEPARAIGSKCWRRRSPERGPAAPHPDPSRRCQAGAPAHRSSGDERRWETRRDRNNARLWSCAAETAPDALPQETVTLAPMSGCACSSIPGRADTISQQEVEQLLQSTRLHRIRKQRVGARLLLRHLGRKADLYQCRDDVLPAEAQPTRTTGPAIAYPDRRERADPGGARRLQGASGFDSGGLTRRRREASSTR